MQLRDGIDQPGVVAHVRLRTRSPDGDVHLAEKARAEAELMTGIPSGRVRREQTMEEDLPGPEADVCLGRGLSHAQQGGCRELDRTPGDVHFESGAGEFHRETTSLEEVACRGDVVVPGDVDFGWLDVMLRDLPQELHG